MDAVNRPSENSISRRSFLKVVAASGLSLGLAAAARRRLFEIEPVRVTRLLMGTVINLTVLAPDPSRAGAAAEATLTEMERLVAIFDHRRPESPCARLNRDGILDGPPPELTKILAQAFDFSERTQGAFDVTVKPLLDARRAGLPITPDILDRIGYQNMEVSGTRVHLRNAGMALTLDGIAKGTVIDGGTAALKAYGFDQILVEAGGDMLADGAGEAGRAWRVGVRHPRSQDEQRLFSTFSLRSQAAATSGDYQNAFTSDFSQHHIIDPRTGGSPEELCSATVLAPTAAEADALSTAIMVLGSHAGLQLAEEMVDVEALLVTKTMRSYRTAGFPAA